MRWRCALPCGALRLFSRPKFITMPQDQRTQLNRKRKAAKKLAQLKEAAAKAPAGKRAAKQSAKKD